MLWNFMTKMFEIVLQLFFEVGYFVHKSALFSGILIYVYMWVILNLLSGYYEFYWSLWNSH